MFWIGLLDNQKEIKKPPQKNDEKRGGKGKYIMNLTQNTNLL